MSRLTPKQYLARRHQLAAIWQHRKSDFAYLASTEQAALHRYFRPSEHLTDAEALIHRGDITKTNLSLPQVAGRAYARLTGIQAGTIPIPQPEVAVAGAGHGRARHRTITVRALRRPMPDVERLAKALLMLARAEVEARRQRNEDMEDAA